MILDNLHYILTIIDLLLTIVNIKTYNCNLGFYADHTFCCIGTFNIMPIIGYNKVITVTKSKKEKVNINCLCS